MTNPQENVAWVEDCMKWRGRVLTGQHCHWCFDWDELPIDETCLEWPCDCAEMSAAVEGQVGPSL